MNPSPRVVIVGAGKAGSECAFALRKLGHGGEILLLGDEPAAPYERPPLSKAFLTAGTPPENFRIRKPDLYDRQGIALRPGTPVRAIDREGRRVMLADGSAEPYDMLVLAMGAAAARPPCPGVDLPGVHVLRDLEDAARLREALRPGCRLLVCGGGFLGLEAAGSARALGATVTVLEREARLLARVAPPSVATFLKEAHTAAGVELRLGTGLSWVRQDGTTVRASLFDGSELMADAVLLATGAVPRTALAQAAGLPCRRGVLVDGDGRTADPSVFAIGDVAEGPHPTRPGLTCVPESVDAALAQATRAAHAILGLPAPRVEPLWFWSDQLGHKIQAVGLAEPTLPEVARPGPDGAGLESYQMEGGRLVAAWFIDRPAAAMAARRALREGRPLDPTAPDGGAGAP